MPVTILSQNKTRTVGVATGFDGLKDLGTFSAENLNEWFAAVKAMFGDKDVQIKFKLSDDPRTPGYAIVAGVEGEDMQVVVCGQYPADGKKWGEK